MTYLTDFSTIQINDTIIGNGSINLGGNLQANNEQLSNNFSAGNFFISKVANTSNVQMGLTGPGGTSNTTLLLTGANIELNTVLNVPNLSALRLPGGDANVSYFLTTNGNGGLGWAIPQGQGNGVVGGTVSSVQFNTGNGFGGDAGNFSLTLSSNNTIVEQVNINTPVVLGNSSGSNGLFANSVIVSLSAANLLLSGGTDNQVLYANGVSGNVRWGNLPVNPPGGIAGSLQWGVADGNGNIVNFNGSANLVYIDNANGGVFTIGGSNVITMSKTAAGNYTIATGSNAANLVISTSGNVVLPTIANVKVSGGTNNFVTVTDGSGNLSFTTRTKYTVATVSAANTTYQANALSDNIIAVSANSTATIVLPAPSAGNVGTFFHIKDTWGGGRANAPIIVSVADTSNIDGNAQVLINGDYNSIQIVQISATNWGVI